MNRSRIFTLAMLLGLTPALGGCAAALIPLAAGGALVGKDRIGGKSSAETETEPVAEVVIPGTSSLATTSVADTLPQNILSEESSSDDGLSGQFVVLEGATELPAPTTGAAADRQTTFGPRESGFLGFYNHALAMAQRDPVDEPRKSALLAVPGSLAPATTECGILPPAVLIDLDPGDGVFDAGADGYGDAELSGALDALRLQGVEVYWISGQSAVEAGAVRRRLVSSGLDPVGRDPLLLMRRSNDRKQTRRDELAETHCVIAIVGDTRADFDELFLYLKDPATAAPLDVLIDNGWFLTPIPLKPTEG